MAGTGGEGEIGGMPDRDLLLRGVITQILAHRIDFPRMCAREIWMHRFVTCVYCIKYGQWIHARTALLYV
jgi:hypothetical protein